jgi:hypothetical protein
MAFTNQYLKRLKDWLFDMKDKKTPQYYELRTDEVQGIIARLEAAEQALEFAQESIYGHYDPYKNDCHDCASFLTPCKAWCPNEKFHEAYETWRKEKGEF